MDLQDAAAKRPSVGISSERNGILYRGRVGARAPEHFQGSPRVVILRPSDHRILVLMIGPNQENMNIGFL